MSLNESFGFIRVWIKLKRWELQADLNAPALLTYFKAWMPQNMIAKEHNNFGLQGFGEKFK